MTKLLITIAILLFSVPAFALRQYDVVVPSLTVEPEHGAVYLIRDGAKSPINEAIHIETGDALYLASDSEVLLTFADGTQQQLDGEANLEVSPLFSNKSALSFTFLKSFWAQCSQFLGKISRL